VEAQAADPGSTLSFYRATLAARRDLLAAAGDDVRAIEVHSDVLSFARGPYAVVLNCGDSPVDLPAGEVVVSSGPLADGVLPADTAVWLLTRR
jgi:alpha-glucosidase